jgi:hypothetical protein
MVLIITYALNSKQKDYAPLFDAIKNNAGQWWHFMDSTWIVNTVYSANEFAQFLYPHIVNTDHLLVARLQGEHQGWLPKEAWDWLSSKQY